MAAVTEARLPLAHQWLCHARRVGVGYRAFLALDAASRAALEAAQVPSSRDLDELKRRLVEMEELLDGLSTRLARAEAREGDDEGDEVKDRDECEDEPEEGQGGSAG